MYVEEFGECVGERRVQRGRSQLDRDGWVFPKVFRKHRNAREGSADCRKPKLKGTEEVAGAGKAPVLPNPSLLEYWNSINFSFVGSR